MAEDPAYRAAHQVPTAQGLRVQAAALAPGLQGKAGLAVGDAVLFWLALQGENGGEHEAAGWLLFADGRPSRLLALPGLLAVALTMAQYQPVGNRQAATRLRRGMADIGQVAAAARPLVFAALLQDTQSLFWQPLAAALGGHPVGTLHVCAHGPLHQLALGLGADADLAASGKISRVVAWPGMPYLRLAADTAPGPAAVGAHTPQAWQIGHDCAWLGEQPLPMAAVEAQLTSSLLAAQQQAHLRLEGAAALQPASAGLVACCHGSQAAHLGSALVLGPSALTVRQVVERKLGAQMVLLPVCLAGETVQDPAGNALGLAAGFLLAGTRVVVGSSKGVPDLLIPWYTTLVLWHRVHGGLGAWAAATLARSQFAAGQFPDDFKQWLAAALPSALGALHTGGDEHPRLLAACVALAGNDGRPQQVRSNLLGPITDAWPWQGDSAGLFSSDAEEHAAALASVAAGVLLPHAANAASLRQAMREMAAFSNIYGTD